MLLCGLCVNSFNILFRDLRGFLPFCLSSGDPGISLWAVGQHHFVYRKKGQAEERGPRPHPKLHFLCGETCQDGALTVYLSANSTSSHFRTTDEVSNWNHGVQLLTGHPNTTPTSKTASDSGPAPRAVNWCYYCCFSHWERESQPKWTPVTITGLAGPCSALLLGTGEYNYNNVCGRSKTNMLRWDQPETSPQTLTLANVSYVSLTTTEQHVHLSHKQERMNVGKTSMQ